MRSLLVGIGLATLLGCGTSSSYGYQHHHASTVGVVADVLTIATIAALTSEPEPEPTEIYVYDWSPRVIVPLAPAPKRAEGAPDLPPLDPVATRAAFQDVDFASCHAPPVYGHAKITLNPDGQVSRVVVEDPANLDPTVAKCLGDQIGKVRTTPFRGGMVVLGTTFRVN